MSQYSRLAPPARPGTCARYRTEARSGVRRPGSRDTRRAALPVAASGAGRAVRHASVRGCVRGRTVRVRHDYDSSRRRSQRRIMVEHAIADRGSGGRCKAGSAVRNPCDPEPRLHRLTRMSKLVRRSEEAMFRRALAPRAERLVVVAFAPPPRRHRRDRANRSADSGVRYGESGDRHGVGRETAQATMPEQATVVRVLRESDHVELLVGEGGDVVAPAVDQRPEPLECGGGGSDRPAFSAPAGVHRRSTPIPPRSGSADAPAATRWSRPAACRATSAYSLAGMSASPKSSTHPPGLNALGVATSPRCRIDLTALRRKLTAHLSRRHRVPRRASPVRRDGRLML